MGELLPMNSFNQKKMEVVLREYAFESRHQISHIQTIFRARESLRSHAK